jgi:hypothetical protein
MVKRAMGIVSSFFSKIAPIDSKYDALIQQIVDYNKKHK